MFTGIVQTLGRVREMRPAAARPAADHRPPGLAAMHGRLCWGDSICVSGVCLTLVQVDDRSLSFDVIAETLAKSTLGDLQPGSVVNLEPALTADTPMGGHFMQGHIDGVGTIVRVAAGTDEWRLSIEPPADLLDYIVPKGSIAIDGVSLTIAAVGGTGFRGFEVALIPTTLRMTTLGNAKTGQRVNLEADILAKTVVHFLRRQASAGSKVSQDTLRRAGFAE